MGPLTIVAVVLCVTGNLMHIITFFLLKSIKGGCKILQGEYLMVLSCIEIWLCLATSLETTTKKIQDRSLLFDIFSLISTSGIKLSQYLILALIVIDKFASIYMPLRYENHFIRKFTVRIIQLIIFAALVISSIFSATYFYYEKDYDKVIHLAAICIWIPFDIFVLTISIFVYGYFAAIRSKLKQMDAWRQLLASTAIIVTFVLFYIIPHVIIAVTGEQLAKLNDIWFIFFTVNLICDAFFATFFNREMRKRLINILCRFNEVTPQ